MGTKSNLILCGAALLLLLSGCQTASTAYHWGNYEEQVYLMYEAPDQAMAEAQIEKLEHDMEIASSKDKPLAPGVRAHMGFLYFQLGRHDEARQAFTDEKTAFPESAQLMDRFIKKLKPSHA